jgi:hypothetical protein
LSACYKFSKDSTLLKLPEEGSTMKFKNFKNQLERPWIAYADAECSVCPTGDKNKTHRHEPNSACFYLVCTYDNTKNRLWSYVGEDCITEMIIELNRTAEEVFEDMRKNEKMVMTSEDWKPFKHAKCCYICNGEFKDNEQTVRDHDHRTGKFRGACHNKCNINYYTNRYLPVVFHNLRGYDSHLIIKKSLRHK